MEDLFPFFAELSTCLSGSQVKKQSVRLQKWNWMEKAPLLKLEWMMQQSSSEPMRCAREDRR